MADPPSNELNYGHFGQPFYDEEDSEWRFARDLGQRGQLLQLGPWQLALPPLASVNNALPSAQMRCRGLEQAAKTLVNCDPSLALSHELLPELLATSNAVTLTSQTYDPIVGDLWDFGVAAIVGTLDEHKMRVLRSREMVVVPAGEGGNILRLIVLARTRQGWKTETGIRIQGPAITGNKSGYWMEEGAPIQQLCFAKSDSKSPFLAARFPTRIVLFRPQIHKAVMSSIGSTNYNLPRSQIDAHPICSISLEQTGGAQHIDVTFNHSYQRQFGIVDIQGNWSVWDIEGGRYSGSPYVASCIRRGTLDPSLDVTTEDVEQKVGHVETDAWARIMWVGDVNTILVCNRRHIEVLDVKQKQSSLLMSPEMVSKSSSDWILDVRGHPTNTHLFFVLTTSRLLLLAVTCLDEVVSNAEEEAGARVLVSWTHYRAPEDITLQLSIFSVSDEDLLVFVSSRLNGILTLFRMQDAMSCSDPMQIKVDSDVLHSHGRSRHVIGIHLVRLQYADDENGVPPSGPGLAYRSAEISFFRMSIMLSDFSVYEKLVFDMPCTEKTSKPTPLQVLLPEWWKVSHRVYGFYPSTDIVPEEEDDFIAHDGEEANSKPRQGWDYNTAELSEGLSREHENTLSRPSLISDFRSVYDALFLESPAADESSAPETQTVVTFSQEVQDLLSFDEPPHGTVFECTDSQVTVSDIDLLSALVRDLLSTRNETGVLELRPLGVPRALGIGAWENGDVTISSLYDTILENWVAPLSPDIPMANKVVKERLARRIAADAVLAGLQIRPQGAPHDLTNPHALQKDGGKDGDIALPNLPSSQSSWSSSPAHAQATPNMSASASYGTTASPHVPIEPNATDPISRLRQHLNVTKPDAPMPPSVKQVLMHWQLGEDPSTYNFETTNRAVEAQLGLKEELSSEQIEKLKRKAERRLRREQREAELFKMSQTQQVVGRPMPFRSSPVPAVKTSLGENDMQSEEIGNTESRAQSFPNLMSQVEPGRFGGRPIKKKPRRMDGF